MGGFSINAVNFGVASFDFLSADTGIDFIIGGVE